VTELKDKVRHALTETRIILPGTQALLGFQLIIMLMSGWDRLPPSSRYVHLLSLAATAVAMIWLLTPAAWHRIVERGEDSEEFHRTASRFLLGAMAVLALAIAGDYFVVARQITGSLGLAASASAFLLCLFYGMWFALPLVARRLKR